MTSKKENDEEKHFCDTCDHEDIPLNMYPCNDCNPDIFGGIDRWEKKRKPNEDR